MLDMEASWSERSSPTADIARLSSALVADLVTSQTVQERALCGALAEVEAEMQLSTEAACARSGLVPVRTQDMKRLGLRVLAAERRTSAMAAQCDALRSQLQLVQRHCHDLLAKNANVPGAHPALNGMLEIVNAVAEPSAPAVPTAAPSTEEEEAGLASLLADVLEPQYAALCGAKLSAPAARGGGEQGGEGGGSTMPKVPSAVRICVDAKSVTVESSPRTTKASHRRHVSEGADAIERNRAHALALATAHAPGEQSVEASPPPVSVTDSDDLGEVKREEPSPTVRASEPPAVRASEPPTPPRLAAHRRVKSEGILLEDKAREEELERALAQLPNNNRPSHYTWLEPLLMSIATNQAPAVIDHSTQARGTPLFVMAGACPSVLAAMQAVVFTAMYDAKSPHAARLAADGSAPAPPLAAEQPATDFWWLKPQADDATRLTEETLHRHSAGAFKNDPGASKKVYAPLAALFSSAGKTSDGKLSFGVLTRHEVNGRARAFIEDVATGARYLICFVWLEDWSSPFSWGKKFMKGKLVYQKGAADSASGPYYARVFEFADGLLVVPSGDDREATLDGVLRDAIKIGCDI